MNCSRTSSRGKGAPYDCHIACGLWLHGQLDYVSLIVLVEEEKST